MDRAPYGANRKVQDAIDECVGHIETDGMIKQRPSPLELAVTMAAKADGTARFCVDYRATTNENLIRQSWPIPAIESHIDTVARAEFMAVCDVQSALHQIPVAENEK